LLLQALKSNEAGLSDGSGPSMKKVFARMKSWIGDFF